jgi:hypothetical protein
MHTPVIIFSMPKAPTREIFCIMRISLDDSSTTCLLFDNNESDLQDLILGVEREWSTKSAARNPLSILSILLTACGKTSERIRSERDLEILSAEKKTKSTPWEDPNTGRVQSPDEFVRATSILNLCHNNLVFLKRAVDFEIEVWRFLQDLITQHDVKKWWEVSLTEPDRQAVLDDMWFELQHTRSRKAQIACLQDRIQVQISLACTRIRRRGCRR